MLKPHTSKLYRLCKHIQRCLLVLLHVAVTATSGTNVAIIPALYGAYYSDKGCVCEYVIQLFNILHRDWDIAAEQT